MEAEAALVWSQGGVELHTVATVDLQLVLVIFPDHAELDHAFGDGCDLERNLIFRVLLEKRRILESGNKLYGGVSKPRSVRPVPEELCRRDYLCKLARTRAQRGGWT